MLQKGLEVLPDEWLDSVVYEALLGEVLNLAGNPYGNFVVQKMVSTKADGVFAAMHGRVVHTAQHKYASNVLERLVEEGGHIISCAIVSELLGAPLPTDSTPPTNASTAFVPVRGFWLAQPSVARASPMRALLIDRYANYVLQKALRACSMPARVALADAVRVNGDQIEGLPYGRQMLQEAVDVLVSVGIMVPMGPGVPVPPPPVQVLPTSEAKPPAAPAAVPVAVPEEVAASVLAPLPPAMAQPAPNSLFMASHATGSLGLQAPSPWESGPWDVSGVSVASDSFTSLAAGSAFSTLEGAEHPPSEATT